MQIDREKSAQEFIRLLKIMDELREQCPWDQKQTMASLRKLTIEETYELADAIIENDLEEIKKELGDIILHIVFYSKIGSEKDAFTISDVISSVCEKLIVRHPHIYGDVKVENEEDVKRNWEAIKLKEGKKSVLEGVPKALPAMTKANRIQEKVKGIGFDWEKPEQVWEKLQEELGELQLEVENKNQTNIESEFGDVFFSMINYARFLDVDPETALEKTNKKFMKRFMYLEDKANKADRKLVDMSLDEMNKIWEQAKELD